MKKKYEEQIEEIRRYLNTVANRAEKTREDLAGEFEIMSTGELIGAEGLTTAQAYSAIAIVHDCLIEAVEIITKLQKGEKKQ